MKTTADNSRWRMGIAVSVAESYIGQTEARVIFVGGSTARGHADGYSDIELGMFWDADPTVEERRRAIANIREADPQFIYVSDFDPAEEYWYDAFYIGTDVSGRRASGVSVEICHYRVEIFERVLDEVVSKFDPDDLKQNLLSGVQTGIPFHGEEQMRTWQEKMRVYPEGLAEAVVKKNAQIENFRVWRSWIERNENLLLLHQALVEVGTKLLRIILALNRKYFYGLNWSFCDVEEFEVQPKRFIDRLRNVFRIDPESAVSEISALVLETYDLVEEMMPEMKLAWYRSVFLFRRTKWEVAPRTVLRNDFDRDGPG